MQSIKNYLEAEKRRREEEGEKGFSLIELIIVVVILGVLAAVAIPIFLNIQQQARDNAAATAAANAATQLTAGIAQNPTTDPTAVVAGTWTDLSGLTADFNPPLQLTVAGSAGDVDSICVTVVDGSGGTTAGAGINSGPGC